MKKIEFFIPYLDKFQIEDAIKLFTKEDQKVSKKIIDDAVRALYIVGTIKYRMFLLKSKSYVSLNMITLRKNLGKIPSKEILDVLEQNELVIPKRNKNGQKSYSSWQGNSTEYRLADELKDSNFIFKDLFKVKYSLKLHKNLEKFIEEKKVKNIELTKQEFNHLFLSKNIDDYVTFESFLNKNINRFTFDDIEVENQNHKVLTQYAFCYQNKGQFIFDESGRQYHHFTRVPSIFRKHIKYNGLSIVELDCVNCQPLLLNIYLDQKKDEIKTVYKIKVEPFRVENTHILHSEKTGEIYETKKVHKYSALFLNGIKRERSKEFTFTEIPNPNNIRYPFRYDGNLVVPTEFCCLKDELKSTLKKFRLKPEDVEEVSKEQEIKRYKEMCENGTFYEELYQEFKKISNEAISRDEFKKKVYKDIFFRWKEKKYENDITKAFKVLFPTIIYFLNNLPKKKDFLSYKLRRIEAEIFTFGIALDIFKDNLDLPFFILHDAIYTTKEHVEELEKITLQNFYKYNIKPNIKIKEYENN